MNKKNIREELGYKIVGWNIDPNDWKAMSSKQITKNIVGSTRDGQVILAHDIHERTTKAMSETLKTLKESLPSRRSASWEIIPRVACLF